MQELLWCVKSLSVLQNGDDGNINFVFVTRPCQVFFFIVPFFKNFLQNIYLPSLSFEVQITHTASHESTLRG